MALERERMEIMGKIQKDIYKDEKELEDIEKVKLPELNKKLAAARGEGDFSENAEYQNALNEIERLSVSKVILTNRVASLMKMNLNPRFSGYISLGSMVRLESLDKQIRKTFLLVPHDLSNALEGRVSIDSPVGKQLIGKRVGDTIFVVTPSDNIIYTIEGVG